MVLAAAKDAVHITRCTYYFRCVRKREGVIQWVCIVLAEEEGVDAGVYSGKKGLWVYAVLAEGGRAVGISGRGGGRRCVQY